MFRSIFHFWRKWRAERLIRNAEDHLKDRLAPYEREFSVTDELTLSTHDLGNPYLLSWDGEALFPFWGKQLSIVVNTPAGGKPTTEQVDVLKLLMEHRESFRQTAMEGFMRFYDRIVYPNRENFREVLELPPVKSPREMYALVRDPSITVDEDSSLIPLEFRLTFQPKWANHPIDMHVKDWSVDSPLFE